MTNVSGAGLLYSTALGGSGAFSGCGTRKKYKWCRCPAPVRPIEPSQDVGFTLAGSGLGGFSNFGWRFAGATGTVGFEGVISTLGRNLVFGLLQIW